MKTHTGYFNPRGERPRHRSAVLWLEHFNPRSPRGERRCCGRHLPVSEKFQPALPATLPPATGKDFNPRSPRGERLRLFSVQRFAVVISTRAPRAGSDACSRRRTCRHRYFNPRSPCGERHILHRAGIDAAIFQPALPARGATCRSCQGHHRASISTRAPRAGSDQFRNGGYGRFT